MKTQIVVALITLISCVSPTCASETRERARTEARLVSFSERVVMNELSRDLSVSIGEARGRCLTACNESGALELAIGLIGTGRSDASTDALVNLFGLRLDGAGAEEFTCQVLTRGKLLSQRIRNVSIDGIVRHCRAEFADLRKRELAEVSDVTVDQVCRTASEIRAVRDELVGAINTDSTCED